MIGRVSNLFSSDLAGFRGAFKLMDPENPNSGSLKTAAFADVGADLFYRSHYLRKHLLCIPTCGER